MPRWDPEAEERLQRAALDLFSESGYEGVTVAQIAARAGLNRRTFSRYFADKRDVLFAGSDRLPGLIADALERTGAELAPYDALLGALEEVGSTIGPLVAPHAALRREVVARSPDLQERGRTKSAAIAAAIEAGLRRRGVGDADASLLADAAAAVFRSGFDRWVDDPEGGDLGIRIREAGDRLAVAAARRPAP